MVAGLFLSVLPFVTFDSEGSENHRESPSLFVGADHVRGLWEAWGDPDPELRSRSSADLRRTNFRQLPAAADVDQNDTEDQKKIAVPHLEGGMEEQTAITRGSSFGADLSEHKINSDASGRDIGIPMSGSAEDVITNPLTVPVVITGSRRDAASVNIPVTIFNDRADESDEDLIRTLAGTSDYTAGFNNEYTLTTTDGDQPEAYFYYDEETAYEDDGTIYITIDVTEAPAADLDLSYRLGGTAVEGEDYDITGGSGTVTVLSGYYSVEIEVEITDDSVDEDDETVIVTLISGSGYDVGTSNVYTLTIEDNDVTPEAEFQGDSHTATESDGTIDVTIDLSEAASADFTLNYSLGGTAEEGKDYRIMGSVDVRKDAYSATIPVEIIDDIEDENDDETIILTLTSGTGYTVGSNNVYTLTIEDDDETPDIEFYYVGFTEDEHIGLVLGTSIASSIDPQTDLTVNYDLGGTAKEGTDYTITDAGTVIMSAGTNYAEILLEVVDDIEDEDDETVILTLTSGVGYNVGSQNQFTLTIRDNDVTPEITFDDDSDNVDEDYGTVNVALSLSETATSDFTLNYSLGGTAVRGTDYTITGAGTVNVGAGASSVDIPVVIIDDSVGEYDETIILTLTSGTGYTVGSNNVYTLTIENDDGTPVILPSFTFASASGSVGEGDGIRNVSVNVSPAPAANLTLNYSLGGSAVENTDYSITGSGTVSVTASSTSVTIPIVILDDTVEETDENVILTLISGAGYSLGSIYEYTLTIVDNDGTPEVAFAAVSGSVDEDAGTKSITVTISPVSPTGFTLNYSLSGSATENTDYSIAGSRTFTVPANAASVDIPVTIVDDAIGESNEDIILTLTVTSDYTVGPNGEYTLTITDDDGAPDAAFAANTGSVGEGGGPHNVRVNIDPVSSADITLNYDLGGTADEGVDYDITGGSGTITITAGTAGVDIPVEIVDDSDDELDETVILTLTGGTGYETGSPSVYTLTITDDDQPEIYFSHVEAEYEEDYGTAYITIDLTDDPPTELALSYRLGGTATEGEDYDITGGSGTVTVLSGYYSVEIEVEITDDIVDESDETVIVTLISGSGYDVGTSNVYTLTIEDNDVTPEAEFQGDRYTVTESEGTIDVTIDLSDAASADLTLNYSLGGTAVEGTDYRIAGSGTVLVEVSKDANSATIPVEIINDIKDEDDEETIILTLTSGTGYTVGSNHVYTLTIEDNDDTPEVEFSDDSFKVDEHVGLVSGILITSSTDPQTDLTLNYDLGGTADEGTDYSIAGSGSAILIAGSSHIEIPLEVVDDSKDESDETVILTLTSGVGYNVGSQNQFTLTITDNDVIPEITFDRDSDNVDEDYGAVDVALSLSEAATSDFTLNYGLSGTAVQGTDYTITGAGTVSVGSGAFSVSIPVVITDDNLGEHDETIILTLTDGTGYTAGSSNVYTLTITDNDVIPVVDFAAASASVGEDVGTRNVTVGLNAAPAANLTLNYSMTGTAVRNLDYTSPGTVSIAANTTSVTIPVTITDDNMLENDETIILTLTSGTGYSVGSANVHTLTVTDNDKPTVVFSSASASVSEDVGTQNVVLNLTPASTTNFTLNYRLGGTAILGTDYSISGPGTILVAANSSSVNIPIAITDDGVNESNETIILTLTNGTGYDIGGISEHTLTITDNDTPEVAFALASASVGEDAGSYNVRVNVNPAPAADIVLSYNLTGTAIKGADYSIANSGTVTVAANAATVDIPVVLIDDSADEINETVILTLTPGAGYDIGSTGVHTLTVTDNDQPTVGFALASGSVDEDVGSRHNITINVSPPPATGFTLSYILTGSATEGIDYSIANSGTVTVAANASSVSIPVSITDDRIDENHETVILTLTIGTGYDVGGASVHTLTITDNDLPVVEFPSASGSVGEDAGIHHVTVSISPATAAGFTLYCTYVGIAVHGTDYTGPEIISVPAGATSVDIPVTIIDDSRDEPNEVAIITLTTDLTEYTLGNDYSYRLIITDNDISGVNFASASGGVDEGAGTHNVTVNVDPVSATGFTLSYGLGGTAIEGTDYSITGSGTVFVAAKSASVNIPVVLTDDPDDENDETIIMTLTGSSEYMLGSTSEHTLTITDNDVSEAVFTSASGTVSEAAGTHNVTVNIDPAPVADFTLTYTLGGTAAGGADYSIAGSGAVSVGAGATSVSIPVVLTDDSEEENAETVILTLSNSTEYIVGTINEYTLTITDNDLRAPPTVAFAATSANVDEDVGTQNVTVSLGRAAPAGGLAVNYRLEGTATQGTDYTISGAGVISAAAGALSVDIPVVITDDTVEENEETVILILITARGYNVGSDNVYTLTITDNDDTPEVAFAAAAASIDEGVGTRNVTVDISPAPAAEFTLNYDLTGTAEEGTDYSIPGARTILVAANVISVNIPIVVTDDSEDENDETIILTLLSSTEYTIGTVSEHTLTITDNDDTPEVTFASGSSSVLEDAGTRNITVQIDPAPVADFTLIYDLKGTAAEGTDYSVTGSSGAVLVRANTLSVDIPIVIIDDSDDENTETVILTLIATGTEYTVGSTGEHTLTITDNDATPEVTFASTSVSVDEDVGVQNVTVNLSSAAPAGGLTLNYSLGGSAVEGTDYSITGSGSVSVAANVISVNIPVEIIDDSADENAETVILTLTSGLGYTVGSASEHTLTIADNDGLPTVAFASASVRVNEDVGTHNVAVNINLSSAPPADFTLNYILTGTAVEGTDYSIAGSGTVFVAANATSANIPVVITDDSTEEESETVILTLTGGTGYDLGSADEYTLTIIDNDATPVVVFASSSTSVGEDVGVQNVTVNISPVSGEDFTLNYSLDGTAVEGTDYIITGSGSVSVAANVISVNIPVVITDDSTEEESETVILTLTSGTGYDIGSANEYILTIIDNDAKPVVAFDSFSTSVGEDVGVQDVTVNISPVSGEDFTLNYSLGGTATEGTDYRIAGSGAVSVPANATSVNIPVEIIDDNMAENNEAVILTLTSGTGYDVGGRSEYTLTLTDNDTPEVTLASISAGVGEDFGTYSITVNLSNPAPAGGFTLNYGLRGTAVRGLDYTSADTVSVPAGVTSVNIPIVIIDDRVAENDETVIVILTNGAGYDVGSLNVHTLTITDNDKAGIQAPVSVSIVEGRTRTFNLSLTSEPRGDVTVTMTTPSGTDLTLIPAVRVFTSGNWNQPQEVTLSAAEDLDFEDDPVLVTLTASGGGYTGILEIVTVTIRDNDAPGIDAPALLIVPEGGSEEFRVALVTVPSGEVSVTVPGILGDLTVSPIRLTFTPGTWSTPQTITLTASEDNDFFPDTETLVLTANGGGYAGVTGQVSITITDDDTAEIIASVTVTVGEGGTETLPVALSAAPSGPVQVAITGYTGTDLTLDQASLTFTRSNWNLPQTVTLTAGEDDADYVEDGVVLTLAASGGDYDGVEHTTRVVITDNDTPVVLLPISIENVVELENAGIFQFPIELSQPSNRVVTVQYTTSEVTAKSGLDYTASRGIVVFDPGATRGVIEITVLDDKMLEPSEEFLVTLSDPSNAIVAEEVVTGTILDDDGSAILRVEDVLVLEEDGVVQFRVLLLQPQSQPVSAAYQTQDGTAKAGEDYEASSGFVTLPPGTTEAMIAVPLLKDGLDWQEETFTLHLISSEHAEIEKAVGVATIQESTTVSEGVMEAYAARFVRTTSVQVVDALGDRFRLAADGAVCTAAERTEMAQLWYSASSWDPSLGELLAGCRMSQSMPVSGGSFGIWGQGAFRQFNGQGDGALTLRGEVSTGIVGVDYRWHRGWMAGVLLAHSRGDGSFEVHRQSGEITSGLTGIYPYVSYARTGWDIWMSTGVGRGNAEVSELKGDLVSRFGALGMRGTLASSGAIGLSYHGDVLVTDAEIEAHNITAEVYRIRAGLEMTAQITGGIRPYVEANVRQDGGSAETGTGLELGGGVRFSNPVWRMRGEVRTQGLVMHTADGFTEWGISGSLQMGRSSEGLMMRLRPSWGRGQGMSMYRQQTILDAVPTRANMHRTELELGYGIPWKDGSARSVMGVTQLPQGMMYRLGGELRPWERLSFSVFGLAHGHEAVPEGIGVNVQGTMQY